MEGLVPEEKAFRISAIVLAAGAGRRFGDGGKSLAPWGGGRLLDHGLRTALAVPSDEVVVVTGARADAVAAHVRGLTDDPRLRLVQAPDWADGLSASLAAGIRAVRGADAAFILLGDMPRIPAAVLVPLAEAVQRGAPAAAPVFQGARGHPVVVSAALFPQLEALTGDSGAGRLLAGLGEALARVEAPDDGVLFDVDTPDGDA
jgi:molybdenum cofactor cytidylyltransferase